jgi:hypothetical protein
MQQAIGAIERCHCDHATRGRGVRLDQVMVSDYPVDVRDRQAHTDGRLTGANDTQPASSSAGRA